MALNLPTAETRWRCGHCGNLTRFDVERRRHTEEFWHMDLSGQPTIEQTTVLDEEIVRVRCRWCGADDGVREVPRPDLEADQGPGGTP
jgi:hypothetical protein